MLRTVLPCHAVAADVSSDPTPDAFLTGGNVDEHQNIRQRFPPTNKRKSLFIERVLIDIRVFIFKHRN